MQIGFLTLNTQERAQITKVLQAIREQQAIDELGIGRLRDAFSNRLFPGMSTLQHHAKYFVVLPAMYYHLIKGSYSRAAEVSSKIIAEEINITDRFKRWAEENGVQYWKNGITGSEVLEQAKMDAAKYVKYDPTYIYWNGMVTYEMVNIHSNLTQHILGCSRRRIQHEEDDDPMALSGERPAFSICDEKYDFSSNTPLPLSLTEKEAKYILEHITRARASKDSLLAYLLTQNTPICEEYLALGDLWKDSLTKDLLEVYLLSTYFSRFVRLLKKRFKLHFSELEQEEENRIRYRDDFDKDLEEYSHDINAEYIEAVLAYFAKDVTEKTLIRFCKNAAKVVDSHNFKELDLMLEHREQEVKGKKRSKMLNHSKYSGYNFSGEGLTYRWELVYDMIKEIREGLGVWQEI